ncbi:hypothetical protein EV361DRAFT_248834 [Lentinula raphanica]|uniref:Uncharacterized protein n=1 Tax=Lentinula raphanica TaxID=153919 RepID=A0AA38UKN7_9AGAR|nr:hypothetical protein F5880DRAFT_282003 [Lentinula raphanica]KAJ3844336.1 hypothetical protein F5878DRAFT_137258 [Lentinula raphanica]KAJ3976691.1 hypothetical protein EV361DRAFT_248834 [Lentinula raphanica]
MDPPDSLEKIFQRVEEESQRRAAANLSVVPVSEQDKTGELMRPTSLDVQRLSSLKSRRRGSVSITRFGQLTDDSATDPPANTPPASPAIITALASQSPFYQSQLLNTSHESLGSHTDNDESHAEDDDQVTQVHRIAARQTLSRTVGSFLPRRLSRARSRPVIEDSDGTLVIGVSVQAATATVEEASGDINSHLPSTTVSVGASLTPKLQSKESKSSLRSTSSNNNWRSSNNWMAKAKDFTKKLRRKSGQPLTQPPS